MLPSALWYRKKTVPTWNRSKHSQWIILTSFSRYSTDISSCCNCHDFWKETMLTNLSNVFFGALPQVKLNIVKWRNTSLWKPWGTSKEFYSGAPFSNSDLNCFLSQCVWLQPVGEKQFAKKIFLSSFIFLFNLWKHIFRLFFSNIHPTWFHTCKEKFMSLTKLRKKKNEKHFDTWQKNDPKNVFTRFSQKKACFQWWKKK